jgi:hypothetical protein
MANATATSQAYSKFEVVKPKATDAAEPIEPVTPRPSWIAKRLHDLRVRIMANTPTKSYWNPTMIGAWCSVITLVLALVSGLVTAGVLVGIQYEQIRSMQQRLTNAEADAAKAKELEILNTKKPTPHPE